MIGLAALVLDLSNIIDNFDRLMLISATVLGRMDMDGTHDGPGILGLGIWRNRTLEGWLDFS